MRTTLFNQHGFKKIVIIFLLAFTFHNFTAAQTTFYLNTNTASPLSPAFNAGWNINTGASRYTMATTRDGSGYVTRQTSNSGAIAVRKCLADQWISEPLAAQTITGTFTGQVRFQQSTTTAVTGQGFLYLRVINANGTIATEVGTVTTTNLTTALTNRTLIALNVGTINITTGQRICVELGWNYSIGVLTNVNGSIVKGSQTATDLPVDNTTTANNNSWLRFSQTLLFAPVNDECANPTTLTPGAACTPVTSNIQYAGSGGPAGACGSATATTTHDVWFRFQATAPAHIISLSTLGSNLTAANTYIETLSGACGGLTSLACQNASTPEIVTGLTVGTFYYVRVYVTANPTNTTTANWNFNICVQNPPANDLCANPTTLTPGAACTPVTSNMQYATSTSAPAGACGTATLTTTYDVWFRFQATAAAHIINLSTLGSNLTAATTYIETFSGACGGLTSLACQNAATPEIVTGLTVGTFYYVRVYVTANPNNTNNANWNFNICVQNPPTNDLCANPTTLTPGAACTPVTSNIQYATSTSAPAGACGTATLTTTYDVWFRFQATAAAHIISLSTLGSNLTAATTYIETFSGACGSLTSLGCQNASTLQSITGLTAGTFYYVRVYVTANPNNTTAANWNFNICVQNPPANDLCANATLLTSGTACTPTTSNMMFATSTSAPAGACGSATLTTTYDVWFRFQATAGTHTITLASLGSNLSAATTYIETFSGTCGSLTSLACQNASTRQTINGLTIGAYYYARVYVTASPLNTTSANWNFNICVQQPPANDDCAGAISLTPGTTCSNTAGTLDLATADPTVPLGCFAAGTYYDVWYKFIATTTVETITLSSTGANFTAPRIQLYSGSCGSLTSISCASGLTLQQFGLTPGATYYVRVANFNVNPSGTGTVANFNICITYINTVANDACTGAVTLTPGTGCTTTSGTLVNASPSIGSTGCGNSGSADVWYRFIATSNRPTITLSGLGANMTTASPYIQLFSGQCGFLTPVACGVSPLNTAITPGGSGLSINNVYYIRVTTNTNTGLITSGTYGFNICVTDPSGAAVDFAKSYINVTDGTAGGTIDPGDILEIRAILVVARPGTSTATVAIDSVAFYDTLSANRGFHLANNNMALRTNEGKLFRPTTSTYFTDISSDNDAAWITTAGAGTDTALQINMGTGATRFIRGKIGYKSKPSNFGSTCIIMATYRVQVNAVYGTKISYGGGAFRYRDSTTNTFYTINFPDDSLEVYSSPGACPDAISPTNIVGDEVNGTFGASSGAPTHLQNRGTSPNTNYSYSTFGGGAGPNDYYYGVANNTSANGVTTQTLPKPASTGIRVHNLWDISGDHTNATNSAKGNLPCNLSQPISTTNPCGYMLVVNAAYRTDVAFEYNFSGACTETYYEISAWIKNICYKCGCDSNGVSSTTAAYIPTAPGDSAGVRPNIAFQINGIDYYTTGDLLYLGLGGTQNGSDTLNRWVRRSFVYKTKPGETNFKMTLRNNAPGGGGNDWAIDDISIRTCYPNMTYSPSATPSVCAGRTLTITDTVRSYYNVYIYYKWQRSTDGGVVWADIPGTSGIASPVLIGPNNYQFLNSYTIPPSQTTPSNNGDKYRMIVATNALNLAGSACNYSDAFPLTLTVSSACIDIDDDNDGIPDYVEFNNPVALQDAAPANGIPNWNDATYPGFVDNNFDGVNDNFDYGADSDNDGISNFLDTDFPGFVDSNGDGVNDNADKDLDGIPNQYDLDSDNDGIPDVVESYGVDTDGNGIIDNYVDTDNDGFSQNVDANNTGVAGSNVGLGAQDFDGDAIPNYLDTDSDNDGIPDVVEVSGTDTNNNGKIDGFVDANADGINDNSFAASALLLTGPDLTPVDGRADNWPFKNLDRDLRPNAYDMDSDGDGIIDVIEAGLPDAVSPFGVVDGVIAASGWSNSVSSLMTLTLRNTDGSGNPDYLDIDSDDDGIPDNIEGMSTVGYIRPISLTDTDGDGLINHYDNVPAAFSGTGILPYDHDGDGIPDYRDLDTDGDGQADIIEGNDFNLNGFVDDLVTLTGIDTDGDGLDNRFDSLNSVTNIKGTSYRMGTGGTFTGDATPGSRTTVQKKTVPQTDRDWRSVGVVLPVEFVNFSGEKKNQQVPLNWTIIAAREIDHFEIERSLDNTTYTKVGIVTGIIKLNEQQSFVFTDDIAGINNDIIYYRLKVVGKAGETKYSSILVIRQAQVKTPINIMPNPASSNVTINLYLDKRFSVKITLVDKLGRVVLSHSESLTRGFNNINLNLDKFSEGVYAMIIETPAEKTTKQLMIIR